MTAPTATADDLNWGAVALRGRYPSGTTVRERADETAAALEALAVQLPLMLEVIAAAEAWVSEPANFPTGDTAEMALAAAVRALREGNDGRLPCSWSNRWSSELDYCGVHDHFRPREALTDEQ
jgi:hypothetical protein